MLDTPTFVTVTRAGQATGISEWTIRRWLVTGRLSVTMPVRRTGTGSLTGTCRMLTGRTIPTAQKTWVAVIPDFQPTAWTPWSPWSGSNSRQSSI